MDHSACKCFAASDSAGGIIWFLTSEDTTRQLQDILKLRHRAIYIVRGKLERIRHLRRHVGDCASRDFLKDCGPWPRSRNPIGRRNTRQEAADAAGVALSGNADADKEGSPMGPVG